MEYDVHFALNGYFRITADDEDDAADKTNELINQKIEEIEALLATALYDNDYVTEVIEA